MKKVKNLIATLFASAIFASGCGDTLNALSSESESDLFIPSQKKVSITPFTGVRVPLTTKYDMGSYFIYGLKINRKRGRVGTYIQAEKSEAEDSINHPYGDVKLTEDRTDIGIGLTADLVDNQKARLTLSFGPKIVLSEITGTMNNQTFSEKETREKVLEANLALEAKLSRRWRISGEIGIEKDFDEDLVDYETNFRGKLSVEF